MATQRVWLSYQKTMTKNTLKILQAAGETGIIY